VFDLGPLVLGAGHGVEDALGEIHGIDDGLVVCIALVVGVAGERVSTRLERTPPCGRKTGSDARMTTSCGKEFTLALMF
jgi:hypothetical protein